MIMKPLLVTAFNETKTIADWSRDERCAAGVTYSTLHQRIQRYRWNPEQAITTPVQVGRPR